MSTQTTLVQEDGDDNDGRVSPDADHADGDELNLTAREPTTCRCACGFEGRFWEFDHTNPVKERYRRKEREAREAGDYHAERSARKNRIHAPYRTAKVCPECEAIEGFDGAEINRVGGDLAKVEEC